MNDMHCTVHEEKTASCVWCMATEQQWAKAQLTPVQLKALRVVKESRTEHGN